MPHHVASSGSRTSGTREPLRTASADGLSSGSSGAVNGSAGCRGGGTGPSGGGGGNDIVDVVDDDCFGATDEVKVYKDEGDEDDDKPAENLSEEKFGLVIETEEDECKPTDIDRRRRLSGDENSNGGCSKSVKASDYFLPDHFPFSYPLIPPYPYPNGSPSAAKIFAHHPAMAAAAAAGFGFYMYQQHHHQQQQQHHGNITTITSEAAGGGGGGGELPSATTSASPSHSDPMSAYHGQPPPPPPAHMGIQPPSAAAAAAAAAAFYLDSKTGLPHHAMYALHSTSTQFPPHPLYASDLAHMPCFDLLSRTSASVPLAPHPSSPFDGAHQVNAPLPTPPTVPHHPTSTSPYSPSILGSIAPNACRPPPLSCWFTTTGPPSNVVPPPPPLLGGSAVYGRRTSPSPIGRRQQHSAIDDSSANSNDSMDDCLRYRPRPSFRHHDPIGIGGSRGSRGSHISPGGGGALCLQTTGHRKEYVKKPLNAFMLFMKECRQKVIEECTLKESAAINQILGRKWHALGRSEQAKYYEMARKEKELHMQLHPGWSARDNYATHTKKKKKQQHHHTIVTVPPHPPHRSSQHHHHNNQHHLHQPQQFHHNRTRDSSTSGLRRSSDSRQPPPCNSPMSTRVKDDPDHRTAHSPPGIFSRSLLVNSDHSKPYRGSIRSAVRLHDDYTDDVKDASGMDSIDVGGCETGTGNRNISPTTVAALMIDEQRGTNIIAGLSGFRQHAAAATARSSVPHLSQSFRSPSSSPSPKSVSVGGGGGLFRSSATGPRHAIATMVDL